MTQQGLEERLKDAYNYGSRARWGAQDLPTTYVGTVRQEERICDLYVDTSGRYWYKTRIMTEDGPVSECVAIFGREIKRRGSA